jgi:hypothetical protein
MHCVHMQVASATAFRSAEARNAVRGAELSALVSSIKDTDALAQAMDEDIRSSRAFVTVRARCFADDDFGTVHFSGTKLFIVAATNGCSAHDNTQSYELFRQSRWAVYGLSIAMITIWRTATQSQGATVCLFVVKNVPTSLCHGH